jgi:hypothetical protein
VPKEPKHYDTPLPHTLPAHLPTPGKAPDWPFDQDRQVEDRRQQLPPTAGARNCDLAPRAQDPRRLRRFANYRRPDLAWAQRNFVHTQMMVEDRYFFDPVTGEYTVDRYLDDLEQRFGGIDSVLIWYVYPNIGIDDRNQTDLASDMPGGLEGLKRAVTTSTAAACASSCRPCHGITARASMEEATGMPSPAWRRGCRRRRRQWRHLQRRAARVFFDAADKAGSAMFQPESVRLLPRSSCSGTCRPGARVHRGRHAGREQGEVA